MPIQVPESYLAYCKDRAVQEAVNHILNDNSLHVPADFEWDELPNFHRAVLAAYQVECEFAIFAHDLWNAVWKPALDACDIRKKIAPRTIADTAEWCDRKLDTRTIWWSGWFGQALDVADTTLVLCPGVEMNEDSYAKARLSLSLRDAEDEDDQITGLDLGADWSSEDLEDGWARTGRDLAPIADDGSIDLDALRKAAADALTAIRSRLRPKPAGGAKSTLPKATRGGGG